MKALNVKFQCHSETQEIANVKAYQAQPVKSVNLSCMSAQQHLAGPRIEIQRHLQDRSYSTDFNLPLLPSLHLRYI